MTDQTEPTPREKNIRVCASCFGLEPTEKEFSKWIKYRYNEYVAETGGYSTLGACPPSFGKWLEMNQSREHWKAIPNTGERK